MKQIAVNLILLSSIIFFNQCKKGNEEPKGVKLGEIKLSNSELNIVPYQLNDSLIFKDSLGNSQLFTVELKETKFRRFHKDGGTNLSTNYYEVQSLEVLLSGKNHKYFKLSLDAPLPSYVSNNHLNKNYFLVTFSSLDTPINSSFANYVDTSDFYYTLKGVSIPYYPSFTIQNKSYTNVYELTNNSPSTIYYNTSDGIISFKTKDEEVWYLDN